MAATLVQTSGTRSGNGSTEAWTWASAPTVGNQIIVRSVGWRSGTAPASITYSDTAGNTPATDGDTANTNTRSVISRAPVTGVPTSSTITFAGGASDHSCVFEEWSGLTASPFDASASAQFAATTSNNAVGPTGTLAQADELCLSLFGGSTGSNSSGITQPAGWTLNAVEQQSGSFIGMGAASLVVSATTAISATWATAPAITSGARALLIATYKIAAAGGTISPTGIASAEAIGAPGVSATVAPTGVASAQAMGAPSIAATLAPTGIATGEALGTPSVAGGISPTGIASAQALGAPSVAAGIATTGIASGEAFGVPVVAAAGLFPVGIGSAEAIGQPAVGASVAPIGIGTSEEFGRPTVGTTAPDVVLLGGGPGLPRKRRKDGTESYLERLLGRPLEDEEPEQIEVIEQAAEIAAVAPQSPSKEDAAESLRAYGIALKDAYVQVYLELELKKRQEREDEEIAAVIAAAL